MINAQTWTCFILFTLNDCIDDALSNAIRFFLFSFTLKYDDIVQYVCETQIPPLMANFNDGQDHKDKYFDTSRKILQQEMAICSIEALIFIFQKL